MFTWLKNLFKRTKEKETLRYEVTEISRNGYRTYYVLDVFLGKKKIWSETMVKSPSKRQINSVFNYMETRHNLRPNNKKQ